MKVRRVLRITSCIANALLLCAGSVILLALSQFNITAETESSISAGIVCFIAVLLLFLFFIIEFVAMLCISDSTFHTAILAMFLFLYALFSRDMYAFYKLIRITQMLLVGQLVQYVCFVGLEISILVYLRYDYCKNGRKLPLYPIFIVAALSLILFFILYHSYSRIIICFFFLFVAIFYYMIINARCYISSSDNVTFALTSAVFFACAGAQSASELNYAGFAPYAEGLTATYLGICILCFLGIYLAFFIRTSKKAGNAKDYKLQNEQLKMKMLIEQIKPHFIFNALTAIKSRYHSDIAAGDNALDLFSEYMRKSLSLTDTEKIPFTAELQNICYYIDFINTMRDDPYAIIFDISVSDFYVPAFSLQPFVENAVKYSNVNKKEGGNITISAAEDGGFISVTVCDNGDGFDVSALKDGAHGINNAKERLKLLFDADVQISSRISEGTKVCIRIKRDMCKPFTPSEK